jgi:hypothetical protein
MDKTAKARLSRTQEMPRTDEATGLSESASPMLVTAAEAAYHARPVTIPGTERATLAERRRGLRRTATLPAFAA